MLTGDSDLQDPWMQLAQAYCWQVLMLEAYSVPREAVAPPSSPASVWPLLDRLVEGGALAAALQRCGEMPLRMVQVSAAINKTDL